MSLFNSPNLPDRFWKKIAVQQASSLVATPCWIWTGYVMPEGYGMFRWDGKTCLAHRVSRQVLIGPIPKGLEPDHLCRVRKCVNPEHTEPVTRRVNVLRGEAPAAKLSKRTVCDAGHELSGDNLIKCRLRNGSRTCRMCYNKKQRDSQIKRKNIMSSEFDALTAQVAANTTVEGSAATLIAAIAAQLAAEPTPAQVSALAAQLKTSADALSAAVVANTPAAPAPTA